MKIVTFSIHDVQDVLVAEAHSVEGLAKAVQTMIYLENMQLPIKIVVSEKEVQTSIRQFK